MSSLQHFFDVQKKVIEKVLGMRNFVRPYSLWRSFGGTTFIVIVSPINMFAYLALWAWFKGLWVMGKLLLGEVLMCILILRINFSVHK